MKHELKILPKYFHAVLKWSAPTACLDNDKADRKTEPQTEYDKYREKIRPHDPHKYGFEDEPQIGRSE